MTERQDSYENVEATTMQQRASLFALTTRELRELEAKVEYLKDVLDQLQRDLILDMAEGGVENMRVGGYTLYRATTRYVRKRPDKDGVTTDMVCEVLKQIGRGDLVTDGYHPNALKSFVTEQIQQNGEVDPALAPLLEIGEKEVVRAVKAG